MNPEDEDARKASKPSVGPAKSAGTTTIKALERVPSGSNPAGAGRRPVTTVSVLDVIAVEKWIRQHVEPAGVIETTHDRPWATVMRVPVAGGVTWFKACAQVQAFEPRLAAELYARWPDRVTEVLAVNEARRWLLLGDAGIAVGERGNPPEAWLKVGSKRNLGSKRRAHQS